jgi:hypothetical protein
MRAKHNINIVFDNNICWIAYTYTLLIVSTVAMSSPDVVHKNSQESYNEAYSAMA